MRMSEENCSELSKSGWHYKPPPQTECLHLQNIVSMEKWLPMALSSSVKKLRNSTLTPKETPKEKYNNNTSKAT